MLALIAAIIFLVDLLKPSVGINLLVLGLLFLALHLALGDVTALWRRRP